MPSGYAYAKSLRTVKTCVGSQFCRFGTQDSMAMGALLERKFERLDLPAKFKMAVNGCPRNCAESCTKDIGIVGNDGGWELFIGGNGGIKARLADSLCKVKQMQSSSNSAVQLFNTTGKQATIWSVPRNGSNGWDWSRSVRLWWIIWRNAKH